MEERATRPSICLSASTVMGSVTVSVAVCTIWLSLALRCVAQSWHPYVALMCTHVYLITLQRVYRGHAARLVTSLQLRVRAATAKKQVRAATVIQAAIRGWTGRRIARFALADRHTARSAQHPILTIILHSGSFVTCALEKGLIPQRKCTCIWLHVRFSHVPL